MLTRAIVRPPGASFPAGITTAGLGAPDLALALAQHEAYTVALESCGLAVTRLPSDERFPDSTFVEDTAVLLPRLAVLTRPGAPTREGEVEAIRPAVEAAFPRVARIEPPGTVDGGDVCEAGDTLLVGISDRTNEQGARQLARLAEGEGLTAVLVDVRGIPGLLHLKSGLGFAGGRRLVAVGVLASRPELTGFSVVGVDAEEEYAANCVLVNGRVLVAAGYPRLLARLAGLGLSPLPVEMSEFRKMDGGPSCLSLRW